MNRTTIKSQLAINCWFAVAESSKVSHKPTQVVLMGYPLVLKRQLDGSVVALYDRCPHVGLPLSQGRAVGDNFVCGYHGLTFDEQGNPVDRPRRCGRVQTRGHLIPNYPVEEKYGWVWVFIGNQSPEAGVPIPDLPEYGASGWRKVMRTAPFESEESLVVSNNLDFNHFQEVHSDVLLAQGVATPDYSVSQISPWGRSAEISFSRRAATGFLKLVMSVLRIKSFTIRMTVYMPSVARIDFIAGQIRLVTFAFHHPISPHKTVSHYMVLRNFLTKMPFSALADLINVWLAKKVIGQDQEINKFLGPKGQPLEVVMGAALPHEQLILSYLKMRAEFRRRGWFVDPASVETAVAPPSPYTVPERPEGVTI